MINLLYIVSTSLLLVYALGSGHNWLFIVIAAYIIAGAIVLRVKNKKDEQQAFYKVVDKSKSRFTLTLHLIVILLLSAYYLFRIIEPDLRPYFFIFIIAIIIAGLIRENHQVKYLLYDTELIYKKKKIPYDQIREIREDANHLIIDTSKYINHIKIKKDLISEEFKAFLENKIKLNGA